MERYLSRYSFPEDQIQFSVHHDGTYVSSVISPILWGPSDASAWLCVDMEPGPSALEPPRTVVVAASNDELAAVAEASLANLTRVTRWSPVETIPVLLMSLLADVNEAGLAVAMAASCSL